MYSSIKSIITGILTLPTFKSFFSSNPCFCQSFTELQGGPQKYPYFSLAITFTKIRPSYSQDFNPSDYFLRGYLKDKVCENNPQAREDVIRKEIRRIAQEMLNRVVDTFIVRVAAVLSYSSTVHGAGITEKV